MGSIAQKHYGGMYVQEPIIPFLLAARGVEAAPLGSGCFAPLLAGFPVVVLVEKLWRCVVYDRRA
jgi:hypothetical protein